MSMPDWEPLFGQAIATSFNVTRGAVQAALKRVGFKKGDHDNKYQ